MKSIYLLFCGLLISAFFWLGNINGALPENTGAPGELTCGRSVCHNVPANNGAGNLIIDFDEDAPGYMAADTHTITISLENSVTTRNGFQILALNGNEDNVGQWILTQADQMQIVEGFGFPDRQYVTHTMNGIEQSSWTLDWASPEQEEGDITFYVSVMATNSNGTNQGDTLYNMSKTIPFDEMVATHDQIDESDEWVTIFPNPVVDQLHIRNLKNQDFRLSLFGAKGEKLREFNLGEADFQLTIRDFQPGLYWLKFQSKQGFFSKKILKM